MRVPNRIKRFAPRVFGSGWAYRLPEHYESVIRSRFGEVRDEAFTDLVYECDQRQQPTHCVDIACGTGLSSLWLASHVPGLHVVGVDSNRQMLRKARQMARDSGLQDRCVFVRANAETVGVADLPIDGPADLVVCSLGFSVIPNWEAAFANTSELLAPGGTYAIFDQFVDGLYVDDFAADQSRRSWELLEERFSHATTTWYGNCFLALGFDDSPPEDQS